MHVFFFKFVLTIITTSCCRHNNISTISLHFAFFDSFLFEQVLVENEMNQYKFITQAQGMRTRIAICCTIGDFSRMTSNSISICNTEYLYLIVGVSFFTSSSRDCGCIRTNTYESNRTRVKKNVSPNNTFIAVNTTVFVFPPRIINHRNAKNIELNSPRYMY